MKAAAAQKREDGKKDDSVAMSEPKNIRVTYIVPETVDKTVELCAAIEGRQKKDIVTAALTTYLEDKGYKPDRLPAKPQKSPPHADR